MDRGPTRGDYGEGIEWFGEWEKDRKKKRERG
jgi:hypothetical protein